MKQLTILLFTSFISIYSFSQTLEYTFDVKYKGKSIGNLFAKKVVDGNETKEDLRTKTKVNLIALSVHVESEVKLIKRDDQLIQSVSYRNASRESEDIVSEISKINSQEYKVKRNGKEFKLLESEIRFCTVDLYFSEPENINQVFSSMFAEYLKLEEVSPNRYKLISPKSRDTFYTYKDGKLIMVEIDTKVGMVKCYLI
ncbi:MAG: DUF6134 family protein [Vicingaceae bacterium]